LVWERVGALIGGPFLTFRADEKLFQ